MKKNLAYLSSLFLVLFILVFQKHLSAQDWSMAQNSPYESNEMICKAYTVYNNKLYTLRLIPPVSEEMAYGYAVYSFDGNQMNKEFTFTADWPNGSPWLKCMAFYKDELYIGGMFDRINGDTSIKALAVWDGKSLSKVGSGLKESPNFNVSCINVYHDTLIIGGQFCLDQTSNDYRDWRTIAGFDGKKFHNFGNYALFDRDCAVISEVKAIHIYKEKLTITGQFDKVLNLENWYEDLTGNILQWDKDHWVDLKHELTHQTFNPQLFSDNAGLYYASSHYDFSGNSAISFFDKLPENTTNWTLNIFPTVKGDVSDIQEHKGKFYLIGYYNYTSDGFTGNLLSFNSQTNSWQSEPTNAIDYFVSYLEARLIKYNNHFFVSGGFINEDPYATSSLIVLNEAPSGFEVEERATFAVHPNPSEGIIHIKNAFSQNLSVEVYSITGEKVYDSDQIKDHVDLRSLPEGIYFLKMKDDLLNQEVRKIVISKSSLKQ